MRSTSLAIAVAVGCSLASCSGVARVDDVIAMKNAGKEEWEMLQWVNEPGRTFDLAGDNVRRLMEADVPMSVIDAIKAKSEEYHRSKGHVSGQDHHH